jgi:FkbM family methyltransferase
MAKELLRRIFRRVESALNAKGYRVAWSPPAFLDPGAELRFGLEFVIAHLMLTRPSIFFVQIGANDGISNDPLHEFVARFDWEGILFEPLPEIFELLQKTYSGNARLRLINAAIAEADGYRTIYTVRPDPGIFAKAHQFSTFCRESLLGQTRWVPDIERRIEERQVRCMSMKSLLGEAGGREIDLLQIDAEGYDYALLKMIDFSLLKPSIIAYEHAHMNKQQQNELARLLFSQGYRLTRDDLDTIAYRAPASFGFR